MYIVAVYYLLTGNYEFNEIIRFAKENKDEFKGNYHYIVQFIEDINNLETSWMRKDINYLLLMVNIYWKTFSQINSSANYNTINNIIVLKNSIKIKFENADATIQRYSLHIIIELLFLHKLNNIYASITKEYTLSSRAVSKEQMIAKSASYIADTFNSKLSYQEIKLLGDTISNSISSSAIEYLPHNSPLYIILKYTI